MNLCGVRSRTAIFSCVAASFVGSAVHPVQAATKGNMQVTSTAFAEGEPIPVQYTCDGKNVSPPLKLASVPSAAKSLVLIADDPDAPVGTWVHWVVYGLPASTTELPEDVAKTQFISGGARQGLNDFKHLGYGGPCPPPGKPHRYFFKVYALDADLDLKSGATKKDVEAAMGKHIVAQGQLMGTYKRK
jgi:Raf kinase inhibitor-like YbhB/YbcL family protein